MGARRCETQRIALRVYCGTYGKHSAIAPLTACGVTKKHSGYEPLICTIGHSTHPLDVFIRMLKKNGVTHVLDVRTVPRSRKNPQFDKATLPESLREAGIKYTHLPGLGGLRHAHRDSINGAWHNASFRGYADYMQTPEF